MKKLFTLLLAAFSTVTYAQVHTSIIDVNDKFHAIEIKAPFDVEIKKGAPSVVAHMDENYVSKIKFEYSNSGVLKVSTTGDIKQIRSKDVLKLSISINNPDKIQASSASKLVMGSVFDLESLNIDVSSAAKLQGKLNISGEIKIDCSSASKIDLTLDAKNVYADCSSASKLNIEGKCMKLIVDASGASKVRMEAFDAIQARVSSSGASKVTVRAQEKFWLNASGASRINYSGNAKIESVNVSGASSVSRK